MDAMNVFKSNPLTVEELNTWEKCPLINPRTNRKITEKGTVYNYIKKAFNKHKLIEAENKIKMVPELKLNDIEKIIIDELKLVDEFNLIDSIDDKDPISLSVFWIQDGDNKKIVYTDISNLILYKDSKGFIRCFEKDTLEYMKAHNILKHPITQDDIPTDILTRLNAKDLVKEQLSHTISEKAFSVFQKFASISIFIESEWFMELDKDRLKRLHYEMSDMYKQNLTDTQKKDLSAILFKDDIRKFSLDEMRNYLLTQIEYLLDVKKEELKYMCNYIVVGSLGLVIPQIKELYPDFCFSFTI